LLEEINRLNTKVIEVRDYLQKAEDYIEQLQYTIEHRETIIPPEIESQITYMTEENHRLNGLITEYIEEIKHLKVNVASVTNVKIEHKIPA
jgi:archaellum component FlaC